MILRESENCVHTIVALSSKVSASQTIDFFLIPGPVDKGQTWSDLPLGRIAIRQTAKYKSPLKLPRRKK